MSCRCTCKVCNFILLLDVTFLCLRWYRYFEHGECKSPHKLRPLLENVVVWTSAKIKTHYTLGSTIVMKSDGGSSVKVSTGEDETAKMEIYVSANEQMRNCALITDFPKQLVAALELKPADLSDLPSLLQVPLASLKALLIRKGITGGNAVDDCEETSVADSASEDWQSQSHSRYDGNDDDVSTTSASSTHTDSVTLVIGESKHASARSEAANTTLRPYVGHRSNSRPTTPRPWSRDHLNIPFDESPSERPAIPRPTAAGLYTIDNRKRNMERLQGFAINPDPTFSSRFKESNGQSSGTDGAFDMSKLREIFEAVEPAPMSTPIQVSPSLRRRARPILNRNEEEMARDFEVGFLGEQFVSPLCS